MSMRAKCACGDWVELHEERETKCATCGRTVGPVARAVPGEPPGVGARGISARMRVIIGVLLAVALALVFIALTRRAGEKVNDELDRYLDAPTDAAPAEPTLAP